MEYAESVRTVFYCPSDVPTRPVSTGPPKDLGYSNRPRGWYDAQGTGHKIDYGRWVGPGSKEKGRDQIFWGVALAGVQDDEYTDPGKYQQPSDTSVLAENSWAVQNPKDLGYSNRPRGWYDAQGTGHKIDYGRWVGPGSKEKGRDLIFWGVALAGVQDDEYTDPGRYQQPSDTSVLAEDPGNG
jgi:hypothetical protein